MTQTVFLVIMLLIEHFLVRRIWRTKKNTELRALCESLTFMVVIGLFMGLGTYPKNEALSLPLFGFVVYFLITYMMSKVQEDCFDENNRVISLRSYEAFFFFEMVAVTGITTSIYQIVLK